MLEVLSGLSVYLPQPNLIYHDIFCNLLGEEFVFEQIIKRSYYLKKHINAPLFEERLNRLECLPEEKTTLFNEIFERRKALQRHTSALLLEERLQYLQYWSDNGAVANTLRRIAQHLIIERLCDRPHKLSITRNQQC
jgi:hypothetical protein